MQKIVQNQKIVLIIASVTVAAIVVVAIMLSLRATPKIELSAAMLNVDGAEIGKTPKGKPLEFIRHDGNEVTIKQVIDKPSLIYFGYTNCPDVCPVDVLNIAEAVDRLAENGVDVQPVFITIDPARDTPENLRLYAEHMHPKLVALTGTDDQIATAAKAYRVIYKRQDVPGSAAEYLMQHTTFTYLVVPEQGLVAMFRNGFPPEQIADDVARVLKAYSS